MNTIIQSAIVNAIKRQTVFQRNANTIVAGIGALAGLLGFLATLPLPIKDEYRALIPVVAAFLTTFATKLTVNGFQPSMIDKLESVAPGGLARHNLDRSVPALDSELPVYSLPSSADVQNTVNEVLGQAHGIADSLHDQGVALATEVQNHIGRHRGE